MRPPLRAEMPEKRLVSAPQAPMTRLSASANIWVDRGSVEGTARHAGPLRNLENSGGQCGQRADGFAPFWQRGETLMPYERSQSRS